jgi:hypothetical protein
VRCIDREVARLRFDTAVLSWRSERGLYTAIVASLGKLEKAGLLDLLGRENFCRDLPHALSVLSGR